MVHPERRGRGVLFVCVSAGFVSVLFIRFECARLSPAVIVFECTRIHTQRDNWLAHACTISKRLPLSTHTPCTCRWHHLAHVNVFFFWPANCLQHALNTLVAHAFSLLARGLCIRVAMTSEQLCGNSAELGASKSEQETLRHCAALLCNEWAHMLALFVCIPCTCNSENI